MTTAPGWDIHEGDCVEVMRGMPEASVDAVVTDPPYGLEFMGKDWDSLGGRQRAYKARDEGHGNTGILPMYGRGGTSEDRDRFKRRANQEAQAWHEAWAREALRVLKPGGYLIAAGGSRTYHRLTCGIEDAGFEVRDCLTWLFGSGFPKSLNVSEALRKLPACACDVRDEVGAVGAIGPAGTVGTRAGTEPCAMSPASGATDRAGRVGAEVPPGPTSAVANVQGSVEDVCGGVRRDTIRNGLGTALKPAAEFMVLARKPFAGTVAGNVLEHGTGALNIDGCRIEGERVTTTRNTALGRMNDDGWQPTPAAFESHPAGRWPANVLLDEQAAALLDDQTGEMRDGVAVNRNRGDERPMLVEGAPRRIGSHDDVTYGAGGASRFLYVAKASSAERSAGLDGMPERTDKAIESAHSVVCATCGRQRVNVSGACECLEPVWERVQQRPSRNPHPTVKPIDLMRWLVRLVTPPGGLVLDPFAGSGTTGCAALLEGFQFVGIERDPEYAAIARARIAWWARRPGADTQAALAAVRAEDDRAHNGQLGLL